MQNCQANNADNTDDISNMQMHVDYKQCVSKYNVNIKINNE